MRGRGRNWQAVERVARAATRQRDRGRSAAGRRRDRRGGRATAATGVDIVKLGFFAGADHRALARALSPLAGGGIRLVAVLMADQGHDLAIAGTLAEAGSRA